MAESGTIPLNEIGCISKFDPSGDVSNLGIRWERWMRSFQLFATGRGVKEAEQRKALLLHSAGEMVQDIYFTLVETAPGEDETVFDVSCKLLNEHFKPKTNVAFERSVFISMEQKETETVGQFITRLRQKVVHCNFVDMNEMIRNQVVEKCRSQRLRRKLLERGDINSR